MARGDPLARTIKPRAERHLALDTVRLILLRIARALDALHQLDPIPWPDGPGPDYRHVMGPLVPSNIFYDPRTQRPQISLVGCTNFLWHFFEPETFRRIINPASGTYMLPEKQSGSSRRAGAATLAPVGREADQYFLGMLALELLEARLLFKVSEDADPPDPLEYLAEHADPQWARRHVQLAGIVKRLLAKDPARPRHCSALSSGAAQGQASRSDQAPTPPSMPSCWTR